jgi:hypothetical protein
MLRNSTFCIQQKCPKQLYKTKKCLVSHNSILHPSLVLEADPDPADTEYQPNLIRFFSE